MSLLRRLRSAGLVLLVLVSCGDTGSAAVDQGSTVVAGTTTTTVDAGRALPASTTGPTTTLAEVEGIDWPGQIVADAAALFRDGTMVVRGSLSQSEGGALALAVSEVLSSAAESDPVRPGDLVRAELPQKYPESRVSGMFLARGEQVPVIAQLGPDHDFLWITELDDAGTAFLREAEWDPEIHVSSAANLYATAIDTGSLEALAAPVMDPRRSAWCQERAGRVVAFEAGGDEIVSFVEFARFALDEDSKWSAIQDAVAAADDAANQSRFEDAVTGEVMAGYSSDVIDQAWRGVDPADWVVSPTVNVLLEPGTLSWRDGGAAVVFSEAGSGRLLGWSSYGGEEAGRMLQPDIIAVMVPPGSGDIELRTRPLEPGFDCLEDAGPANLVIPFDALAGRQRAAIDLDAMTYRDWDGTT